VPCIFLGLCSASSPSLGEAVAPRESSRTCPSLASAHAGWTGRLLA
jgi:hypothetical protein